MLGLYDKLKMVGENFKDAKVLLTAELSLPLLAIKRRGRSALLLSVTILAVSALSAIPDVF